MGSGGSKRKTHEDSTSSKQPKKQKKGKNEYKHPSKLGLETEKRDDGRLTADSKSGGDNAAKVSSEREMIDGENGSTATAVVTLREKSSSATGDKSGTANGRGSSSRKRFSFYDTVDAAEVLPYLVIGNLASARNPGFLKGKRVGFILNLTTEGEAGGRGRLMQEMDIEHLQVQMEDDEDEEISGHFETCFEFIKKAKGGSSPSENTKKKNAALPKTVLIHSNFDLSRTAAIVLAYLMKEQTWSLRQANDHLKKCHSTARPNDGFAVQLLRYEQELHGKMSMTLKDFYQQP